MTAIPIIIPSRGRAETVLTKIDRAILWVRGSEGDAYTVANPETEIHCHEPFASLAEKRQAIYEFYGDVFMVDDDITAVSRMWPPGGEMPQALTPSEASELIQVTYENAKAAGCYLFGFSNHPRPQQYYPGKPIRLSSYINASAFGLRKTDKLYFSTKTVAAESHWINLLNAYVFRKSWCDRRFNFHQKLGSTAVEPGGQSCNRSMQTERADTIFLRRMFGKAVRIKPIRAKSGNLHKYQRELRLPF